MDSNQKSSIIRTRRKQTKPQRKKMDSDIDETSLHTDNSLAETENMSPDSNHNLHLSCNELVAVAISTKMSHIRNGSIEDDQQQAVMEASEAMETVKVMNGTRHADDSFDDSQDDQSLSQKYYGADTPSSDLVIDERSIESQFIEPSDSPDMSELLSKSMEETESSSDNVPVVAGVSGNSFLKESSNASLTEIPGSEPEPSEFSPSAVKCLHCHKYYGGFETLKEHIQVCHPERAIGYSCLQCNAAFPNRDQLDKHELLHSPNAQVSCKVCNKTFANVYRLQRHMISHDESAVLRKFKCPQCEKAFKFKHHLKEHIRIHSGEKPFVCQNCGKRFSHSGSYSSHMTSKKCLIMNLKVNHRSRTAEIKPISNGPHQTNNYPTNRISPNKQKSISNSFNNNNISNNNNNNNNNHNNNNNNNNNINKNTNNNNNSNVNNINNNNNNHSTNNNNNIIFTPILPKYSEGTGILIPNYPTVSNSIHPFYLHPSIGGLNQTNLPYPFRPALNQFLEQLAPLNATFHESKERTSDELKNQIATLRNGDVFTVKKEIKLEEEEEERSKSLLMLPQSVNERRTGGDLEAVKRILETVNETVTKQLFAANIPKLSSASCSSECPSLSSEVPSPAVEDSSQSHDATCKFCGRGFHSYGELQYHEKKVCAHDDKKTEGLAAKLEEVISNQPEDTNGMSAYNSDSDDEMHGSGKEYMMTEDEDSETLVDGRKVRVRSQIAEEQLIVLKQYYALNPRPKREELEKISQKVGFPVRVVQVWFQNNRARDRREGRLVHIPYAPTYSSYPLNSNTEFYPLPTPSSSPQIPMDQPLDLSTKKSFNSSPMTSPYRYDSDECVAVNLSRKSPSAHHVQNTSVVISQYCMQPDRMQTPPPSEKRKLPQRNLTPNSSASFFSMERIVYANSQSPVTSSSPNYNGSCSPNSSDSHSWKQEYIYSNEMQEQMKEESKSTEEMSLADSQTVVTPVKKAKLNSSSPAVDSEIEGQFSCQYCDKAFTKQSSLARHKYEHSGQRPHKCDICTKAFKHKHHLTEHKRLHSGEKPFQCKKCLKRFSHSGSFSQHMNHRYSYCKPYRD